MGWCIRQPQHGGPVLASASTLVQVSALHVVHSQLLARVPVRADTPPPPPPTPSLPDQHLFSWIKHREGLTFSITRGITSRSAHSIRQPEDGGGPRAHQPARREPAEKLLLPRYDAVIDLGVLPATGSLRETENTSK